MFLLVDDNPGSTPIVGDGTSICMSALPLEELLLVERNNAAHLSFPKYLLIFLQNKRTTQLVEQIRKIKCQQLAIQKLVIRGLIVRGLVIRGLIVLDCVMDFLIKILAELSP